MKKNPKYLKLIWPISTIRNHDTSLISSNPVSDVENTLCDKQNEVEKDIFVRTHFSETVALFEMKLIKKKRKEKKKKKERPLEDKRQSV